MRIAVIARPHAIHGGIEQATAGLLGGLVERGEDVELLTPGPPPPIPGIRVRHLPIPRLPPTARLLALAAAARWAVRAGRWDIVQSHERTVAQDVYRAGEGCHGAYLAAVGYPRSRRLYHAVTLCLERRVFAWTPRIVAIAARGRDEIRLRHAVPDARLAVVYNGVDLRRFDPAHRARYRGPARQEVGLGAQAFMILFVGSGFARKGLATAIDGLAAMADNSAHLLVIGKGSRAALEPLASRRGVGDRVRWLGVRADTERWYAAADAVVLPTLYEPFGNVHLESLASGVPMVTSSRAGGAELIRDGANGFVVDPLEPAAVARALDQIRAAPAGVMAEAARRSAEPFTHAAQAEGFAAIYRGVRSHKPSGSLSDQR